MMELVPSLVPVNQCNISLDKMGDTRSPRVSLLIRHTIYTTVVHTWLFNATIHHGVRNNLQLNRYDRFSSSRRRNRNQRDFCSMKRNRYDELFSAFSALVMGCLDVPILCFVSNCHLKRSVSNNLHASVSCLMYQIICHA